MAITKQYFRKEILEKQPHSLIPPPQNHSSVHLGFIKPRLIHWTSRQRIWQSTEHVSTAPESTGCTLYIGGDLMLECTWSFQLTEFVLMLMPEECLELERKKFHKLTCNIRHKVLHYFELTCSLTPANHISNVKTGHWDWIYTLITLEINLIFGHARLHPLCKASYSLAESPVLIDINMQIWHTVNTFCFQIFTCPRGFTWNPT